MHRVEVLRLIRQRRLFIKGQPSTIVMFLDAGSIVCLVMGCVMPLIPRLMKFWKLPINEV